jgi:hypothetical protein
MPSKPPWLGPKTDGMENAPGWQLALLFRAWDWRCDDAREAWNGRACGPEVEAIYAGRIHALMQLQHCIRTTPATAEDGQDLYIASLRALSRGWRAPLPQQQASFERRLDSFFASVHTLDQTRTG